MTVTVNLIAADGATSSITLPDPVVNTPQTVESYYAPTVVPGSPVNNDGVSITVGMQFSVAVAGAINAVRYYKGEVDTGDMVALWDVNGNLIDHVAVTETAVGWQRGVFSQPWSLTPVAIYTVGYFTPKAYAGDANKFTAQTTQNGITVPANGGVFVYGATLTFPGSSFQASSYYVDLEFRPGEAGQVFTPPPPPTQSPYVPAGYILQEQMSDEFTSANLDISKWWTRGSAGGGTSQNIPSNGELQLFEESNNHVMTGSTVKLMAYAPTASKNYYSSGMLRGKWALNVNSLTTGFYVEMRAKMPKAYGSWTAFWSAAMPEANGDAPWPPEADFAEFMMNNPSLGARNPTTVGMSVKYNTAGPNGGGGTGPWNGWQEASSPAPSGWTWNGGSSDWWATPVDFSADFHIYAFHYYPGVAGDPINANTGQPTHHLDYYIDGNKVQDGYYDAGMGADGTVVPGAELLFDYAVGGIGGLTPTPSQFPDAFEIDYVRTYISQTDSTALVADTIGVDFMPPTGG